MTSKWRRYAGWALLIACVHQGAGWLLAWSETVGGAFSPGPYAVVGVSLALCFVMARLLLWLVVIPMALAAMASTLYSRAVQRFSD